MSEGTESTHKVHIRKKRLLDSLNECPELNKCGLNQQDASGEPAFVLVSFDENQFKKGNESIKVLELHPNQEMHMNSSYESDFSHEQQSNVVTIEENKIPNLNETFCIEEHEENPNKGKELCQENRHLECLGMSQEVLREIVEEKEKLPQPNVNGQEHFGNVEMQLTNLFNSKINMTDDENKVKNTMITNTNKNASVDNELETICNVAEYLHENFQMISCTCGNESCQELQADNAMQLTSHVKFELNTTKDAMENMMTTDTENFASFDNLSEATDNVAAYLIDNFRNISWNVDNKPRPKLKSNINKSDIEKLKRYVEHLENVKRIKMENLRKTVNATIQFLRFLEKIEQQEQLQENQNIDNDESNDKKDFKMLVTENDNKNDIPQAHNQNEDVSKSTEYQEQHRMVAPYNDFNNFELQYNKKTNLPHCSKIPEEEINIMKNAFENPKIQLEKPQMENISIPSSTSDEHPPQMQIENRFEADANGMVCIGPNGTMVPRITLESINWSLTGAAVTRKILVEIFGRETLAACNLTGKPSPAFVDCNKPVKGQLDPIIVADIIHLMGEQKGLSPKEVRNAVITKCADENKMLRMKEKKRQSIAERNRACGLFF